MLRTHTCGELRLKDEKTKVTLAGWNSVRRDHGGVIFIDLRDKYGLTQVVFDPSHNKKAHAAAERLSREDVIQVKGTVRYRGKGLENHNLPTGQIEVIVDEITVLNKSATPPIEIDDNKIAHEDMRLKYRYLDLRRSEMQKNLRFRHTVGMAAREYLDHQGFTEVETPVLMKSTPEGARDYVVPSRVNPGKFYALPQSPQLYKQILMVSGVDKYFQFARCLRDEDLRADRQPEHTQIDIEMSFVERDDVLNLIEGLYVHLFKKALGITLKTPFPRINHKEAMEKYGCDKPDLRFDLELTTLTEEMKKSEFSVFKSVIEKGGIVKAINAQGCGEKFSRNEIDSYIAFAQSVGAKGLAWMKMTDKGLESNIVKFFPEPVQKEIIKKTKAKKGDLLFFTADTYKNTNEILNKIRNKLGQDLKLIKENDWRFCFTVDFPLFAWNEEEQHWEPEHHMFCMPKKEDLQYLETDPGKVYCTQYDLVLNGWELGSGSIRINDPEIQKRVMKVIGMTEEEAQMKFGFLLEAFKYGAPPHGGVGLGFDRTVALMAGYHDIREVIAFPKNKAAQCPMDGSPSEISDKQLKELHIKADMIKKK